MKKSLSSESGSFGSSNSTEADVLSRDELAYLRALFAASEPEDISLTEVGLFASDETLLGLFPTLAGLEVSAERAGYRYVFPLESVHSQSFKLRVQTPRIYDIRGTARSWRAPLEPGDVEIRDASGSLKRPLVANLSASGLLLSAEADGASSTLRPHSDVNLWLKIAGHIDPMGVKASVVRSSYDEAQRRQLLAFKFSAPDRELEKAICACVFRAHCALSQRVVLHE